MRPLFTFILLTLGTLTSVAQTLPTSSAFKTDLSRSTIDLAELRGGGPPKDGIPAIYEPQFDTVAEAAGWLDDVEPVLVIRHAGQVRVYPFQILLFHEMANDQIGDTPILATYCPLCNSAIAFDRRVAGRALTFGVSGMLRNSDMVMYDRETETLWQQFTGDAIVGQHAGTRLKVISSQVTHFGAVRQSFPEAQVLNRDTGHRRPYRSTPYSGYERRGRLIFPVKFRKQRGLQTLDRVVGVTVSGQTAAHSMASIEQAGVISGSLNGTDYVVFHNPTAVGSMDRESIKDSNAVGSVGVFSSQVAGQQLTFERREGQTWDH